MANGNLDPGWVNTVNDGITNKDWDAYDSLIQTEISGYNSRLATTPGYTAVDWKMVKAMLWAESGGPKGDVWTGRVMQIGNATDKGWPALKAKDGAYSLVVPNDLKATITVLQTEKPQDNIRAAIAYLFLRMSSSDYRDIPDPLDSTVHTHVVKPGEVGDTIAKAEHSTPGLMKKANPGVNLDKLKIGQTVNFIKGEYKRVILGWVKFTTVNVKANYNGTGDPLYVAKLDYVFELFGKLKR